MRWVTEMRVWVGASERALVPSRGGPHARACSTRDADAPVDAATKTSGHKPRALHFTVWSAHPIGRGGAPYGDPPAAHVPSLLRWQLAMAWNGGRLWQSDCLRARNQPVGQLWGKQWMREERRAAGVEYITTR